jgi:hypothetical protein
MHTSLTPSWRSLFSIERSTVLGPRAPMRLLDAHLAKPSRILNDFVSLNSQPSSFLCALLAHTRSMPTWQSFSELLRASDFYFQTLNGVLEYSRVFGNPMKILQWILLLVQNSKNSLLSCHCLHTFSMPSWRSISPTERSVVLGSFYTPFAPAQCPPGRALRILSDFGLLRTLSRVPSSCTSCLWSMSTWQSSYRILSDSFCNFVSATQPYLLRCSATSQVFFLSC